MVSWTLRQLGVFPKEMPGTPLSFTQRPFPETALNRPMVSLIPPWGEHVIHRLREGRPEAERNGDFKLGSISLHFLPHFPVWQRILIVLYPSPESMLCSSLTSCPLSRRGSCEAHYLREGARQANPTLPPS